MAFRDRYALCKQIESNKISTRISFKEGNNDFSQASFRYLLFNHHTGDFRPKHSEESRLFSITSCNNLTNVQDDLKEAIKTCVKLPQISLVVFYDKEAKRLLKEQKSKEEAQEENKENKNNQ